MDFEVKMKSKVVHYLVQNQTGTKTGFDWPDLTKPSEFNPVLGLDFSPSRSLVRSLSRLNGPMDRTKINFLLIKKKVSP